MKRISKICIIGLALTFSLNLICSAQVIYTKKNRPAVPDISDLPLCDSLSEYGITWKFDKKVHFGKFITGDYYIVGDATVIAISPAPKDGRNGSMLNALTSYQSGYDSRTLQYSKALTDVPPIKMKPGYSLVSSISLKDDEMDRPAQMPRGGPPDTFLKSAAVLTCLSGPASVDAFRPSYCDTTNRIYRASDLRRELLPKLKRVSSTPELSTWERIFERPWIDHTKGWGNRQTHPTDNMPEYSRELSRAVSIVSLMLICDFTEQQKENLLLHFVQYGIDLWGVAQAGGGWEAQGGYGNGRKWPIIFAGMLLQDEKMQNPNKSIPGVRFGEDEQTKYGNSWTGAKVIFAGHTPVGGTGDRGAYEHLPPAQWPGPHKAMSEAYRRVSTSVCWVGQALTARIMHAQKLWNHDAWFDYIDRWMTEDDTKFIEEIEKQIGKDDQYVNTFRANPQRQAVDKFVDDMWAKYRGTVKTSNWK
jgi:hypothetical protein